MSAQRVAVVTGANKGIGLEICRQLGEQGILVVLTSRDKDKGMAAAAELEKAEIPIRYFQLDVTRPAEILALGQFLKKEFGRCDILVNNAGIFPDRDDTRVFASEVDTLRQAMETNVYGPFLLCQELVPLMKKNGYGRIVNMSSGMGQLSEMNGHCPGYRISKTSLNALTRVLADELQGTNILVNSMCPGWVKTDMGGPGATRSVEEGADTAVWLAMLPDKGPTGKFFRDRKEIPW